MVKHTKMVSTKNKSEAKGIKLAVFCRKIDFFSLFRGKFVLYACYYIIRYNSSEEEWKIESRWFSQTGREQTKGYLSSWSAHRLL